MEGAALIVTLHEGIGDVRCLWHDLGYKRPAGLNAANVAASYSISERSMFSYFERRA